MKKNAILYSIATLLLIAITFLFRLNNWEGSNRIIYVALLIILLITVVLVLRHKTGKIRIILLGISFIGILIIGTGTLFRIMNWSNTIFWPINNYHGTQGSIKVNYESYPWPVSNTDKLISMAKKLDQSMEEKPYSKSLLIVHNDSIILEKYFNGGSEYNAFNIASCTKSIVSTICGLAIDQGLIESEDNLLKKYLSEYYTSTTEKRKEKITLKHLLTMQAGWSYGKSNAKNLTGFDWVKSSMDNQLDFEPGTAFSYSNIEPYIILKIIDDVCKHRGCEFIKEQLCEPLGINIAKWPKTSKGNPIGYGGIFMTSRDMARYGQLYLKDGIIDGKRILSEEWVKKSTTNYISQNLMPQRTPASGYGYYWWIDNYCENLIIQAAGNGGQHIFIVPNQNLIVVTTAEINVSPKNTIENSLKIIDNVNEFIYGVIDYKMVKLDK